MSKPKLTAIYPAYHPAFAAECKECKRKIWSNAVLATETPNEYICCRCAFVYYFFDSRDVFNERDMRELNEYGNLYGKNN